MKQMTCKWKVKKDGTLKAKWKIRKVHRLTVLDVIK
jgi:hypothetical protein